MISVDQALSNLFRLVSPLNGEPVPLNAAGGRILCEDVIAAFAQPPFPASAMDGYAVRGDEVVPGATFAVIGESAAGTRFDGAIESGQAVRIFTGAPVPDGGTHVIIQEDVDRTGDTITLKDNLDPAPYIRPAGTDFEAGARISAPRRLTPADISLAAAMNAGEITVTRRPRIAVLATGDELVMPGEIPGEDQIVASNIFGLKAMLDAAGALTSLLPIARDNMGSLKAALGLAGGSDLLVTVGGASVGDHDLVAQATEELGMERAFYKVAMRPGKPLMAGRIGDMPMIGLPGNPVSALVCGEVFLRPVLDAMLGLPARPRARTSLPLAAPARANGPREHYARGVIADGAITQVDRQDSSLLSVLSTSNALIVRPPNDAERAPGELVEVIRLD